MTIDYVNPEAPWPHLAQLRRQVEGRNFRLRARFAVYPEYIHRKGNYLPAALRNRLEADADAEGSCPRWNSSRFGRNAHVDTGRTGGTLRSEAEVESPWDRRRLRWPGPLSAACWAGTPRNRR